MSSLTFAIINTFFFGQSNVCKIPSHRETCPLMTVSTEGLSPRLLAPLLSWKHLLLPFAHFAVGLFAFAS